MAVTQAQAPARAYRRDEVTRRVFGGLAAFGFLNAVLGPALPYLRAIEHISYVAGALHQVAFALGGGLAGLLAARDRGAGHRRRLIAGGLAGAAVAGLGVAYGAHAVVTIAAAWLMSLCGTSALVRMWGLLADIHGPRRTVALAEGEVLVSVGSIITPLLVSALAATALTWRGAIVVGGLGVLAAALVLHATSIPAASTPQAPVRPQPARDEWRPQPTLVIVFAVVALEFGLSFWLASYLHDDVGLPRGLAVLLVSALYAANLIGRVVVSRAARRLPDALALAGALVAALIGLPALLTAHGTWLAVAGIAVTGAGIGAMFPLTSSLHVAATRRSADSSVGQVLTVAAAGQITGPLAAGVLAQAAGLRTGLLVLPVLVLVGLAGLTDHGRRISGAVRPARRPG